MMEQITAPDTLHLWAVSHELPQRPVPDTTEGFQSIEFPEIEKVPSFFKSHQLIPAKKQPVLLNRIQSDWIAGIFVLCFILLAWVNVYDHKRFRQVLGATFSKRYMSQLVREGDIFSERITVVLGFVYLLVFPLLGYQFYDFYLKPVAPAIFSGFRMYLILMAAFGTFWFMKIMMIRILGAVFKTPQTTSAYLLNIFISAFLSAISLLPVMIFTIYLRSEILLYFAAGLIVLLFFYRFIKGFIIGISLTRFSYFYLFVYLCTIEILPWIVLAKLLLNHYT